MTTPGLGLRRFLPDGFVLAILMSVLVAALIPVSGVAAEWFDVAVKIAIAALFFMYGGRLHPREALAGLRHWRLHAVILAFTYLTFPVLGQVIAAMGPWLLPPALIAGVLYMCAVPATVQSSIGFTSIAGGNVAGAVVSASMSNLLGVVLTPLIVVSTMSGSSGLTFHWGEVLDLCLQILLPFIVGQLSRPLAAGWLKANHSWLKVVDRGIIVAIVYAAFSRGMVENVWAGVSLRDLAVLLILVCLVLAFMLWFTWWLPGKLGFTREDRIAIQFCGTKKSLATGVPMALVLFPGAAAGLLVLPLMLFHQVQLMVCSVLAARYARQTARGTESTAA